MLNDLEIQTILTFLPVKKLLKLRLISKQFNDLCSTIGCIWKVVYGFRFGNYHLLLANQSYFEAFQKRIADESFLKTGTLNKSNINLGQEGKAWITDSSIGTSLIVVHRRFNDLEQCIRLNIELLPDCFHIESVKKITTEISLLPRQFPKALFYLLKILLP